MPASKSTSHRPRRDSWTPAQVLLRPSIERDDADIDHLNLAKMDEDPFIYFLTPTPSSYADDSGMDFDMDFDAGIEDAKNPPQIVRSISPSSLGGLGLRPPTPPRSPATPELDYDLSATPDDHEQYDYMDNSWPPRPVNPLSLPRRLKDKFRPGSGSNNNSNHSLAPHPSLRTSSRGRAASRSGPKPVPSPTGSSQRRRSRRTPGRLSPHAWREPSPDVWAIEEEPELQLLQQQEEERLSLHSEMGHGSFSWGGGDGYGDDGLGGGRVEGVVDIPAAAVAKPKKRVRFVLPGADDVWGTC